MAKIVLVNPSFEPIYVYKKNKLEDPPNVPRAILCLGTYLKSKGHHPVLIDAVIDEHAMEMVMREAQDAAFVGFSVMSSQITNALKLSDLVKKNTKAQVVWGGMHSTLFTKQTCEDAAIDFVVHGEGDEALLELVDGKDPSEIKNLAYKKDGQVIVNERRGFFDIDKVAHLDYDLLDVEKYITRTLVQTQKKVRMLPIMSSRGCPHRCSFCIHVVCKDRAYRTQSVDCTVNEIKRLKKLYNIQAIKFAEDNFFVNRKRVKEICEKIKDLNIKWVTECRADYFRPGHVDEELLNLMRDSGCAGFTIGAESGSEKTLNVLKKDITPQQIINAAEICYKYNFVPSFSFIVGIPGETKEDVLKTVKVIETVVKKCPILIGGVGLYLPYPGGELYNYCFEIGRLTEPRSLREWTSKDNLNMMTNPQKVPWVKNSEYMKNVAFYGGLYFFTNRRLSMYIKRDPFLGLGFAVFVLLTRLRFKTRFFYLSWDKKLFNLAIQTLSRNMRSASLVSRDNKEKSNAPPL